MRVLFLIPKARPPSLEGNFSNAFKDFVALCLIKDPAEVHISLTQSNPLSIHTHISLLTLLQRPTAKELLQHRFVKYARRTSQLSELIDRHREWKMNGPKKDTAAKDKKGKDALADESSGMGTVMSNWAFDTVRAEQDDEPVIGTVRQVCLFSCV